MAKKVEGYIKLQIPPELSEPFSEDLLKANRLDGRETSEDLWQEKK